MSWTSLLLALALAATVGGYSYNAGLGHRDAQGPCAVAPQASQSDRDFLRAGPRLPETGNRRY